jgi:hypothetical protein
VTNKSKAEKNKSIEYKNKESLNNTQENPLKKSNRSFICFAKNHA